MEIIEAPSSQSPISGNTLFLAGGITNCPDWQAEILTMLRGEVTIYNPRRKDFPIGDPAAARLQIEWEYRRLAEADMILFWFARGSLNPIVLYELGMWGNARWRKIFIGCDPEYQRDQDVRIQTELARPEVEVVTTLQELADQVNGYLTRLEDPPLSGTKT